MAIVSCLETRSMDARHEMEVRNHFNQDYQYSVTSDEARATDSEHGRGVGTAPVNPLPNCDGVIGSIRIYNFQSAFDCGAGTPVDRQMRTESASRSLFNYEHQYDRVTTTANQKEGQYVVG